jgi:hypothetical protein
MDRAESMRRLLMLVVVCLASCKSTRPPPEPKAALNVDVPGVNVRVQKDGGVKVYDPTGRSGVPTILVPGR